MNKKLVKGIICVAAAIAIWLYPVPAGLSVKAWQLFCIYIGTILGIMLRPLPSPVVVLLALGASSIFFKNTNVLLAGYGNHSTWMIFAAFLVSTAFGTTGLGHRIAYYLLAKLGSTTKNIGYIAMLTDLVLSPGIPSNTARTGGIEYPIFRSIASLLGSDPGPTARKLGAYLSVLLYQISLNTGYMFVTALGANVLLVAFAKSVLNIEITWMLWAKAAVVPGLICLLILPYWVYKIYPPSLTVIDKNIASKGYQELGPITAREKILAVLFILSILGWATGSITKISAEGIAIAFVALSLVTKVMSWEDIVNNKNAWSTLIWFGGVIGIANALAKEHFFEWMSKAMGQSINFVGYNPIITLGGLLFLSLIIRYLFASMTAFVTTMIPVFFTLGLVAGVPLYPLFFLLSFGAAYGCCLTHYAGACAPILFGPGYVDLNTWWKIGAITVIISYIVHMTIGLGYWKLIGLW